MLRHASIALLLAAAALPANALTLTLGDQDFANGAVIADVLDFNTASLGEPAPFDSFKGSDGGSSFSEAWTFSYAPAAFTAASLTFGICDHDSAAAGNQVASFTADGNDLTAALNALFNASGGAAATCNVYVVGLSSILSTFVDGSVTFALTLQGPGLSPSGEETPENSAGLDFAQLDLRDPNGIPEPAALALLGAGLIGLALARRRTTPT